MRFDVITLFPDEVLQLASYGVVGRAIQDGKVTLNVWNPRDFTDDIHRTVDDRPFGGGPGMVMKIEPLKKTLAAVKTDVAEKAKVILLSPQGQTLEHKGVKQLAQCSNLILIAGRYEGIDERFIETQIDEEWSIGDFVLSGGELPAMVLIDAVSRWLPEVLGHESSAEEDSFVEGLLDHPHYTRPEKVDGLNVPEVLLSGNHKAIARWRKKQALGKTWQKRPDLLKNKDLSADQQALLDEYKQEMKLKQ